MSKKSLIRTIGVVTLSSTLFLGACSTDDGNEDSKNTNASSSESNEITVKHARGSDAFPVSPENVVAVGPAIDNLLALGIKPAAVVMTPKDENSPWRDGKLDGVKVIKQTDFKTLPKEDIAATNPDMIVGDYWNITESNYKELSEIAPTLGGIGEKGAEAGWKPQLEELGKIFDKEDEAKKVIEEDQKLFDDAKEELPNIKDKTGVVSQYAQGSFGAVADPEEVASSFIYDLGMKLPDTLTDGSVKVEQGRVTLSPEHISKLAADFMVIYNRGGSTEEFTSIPGYKDLPQVKSGATLAGDEAVVAGLNTPTSLSRAWVLDKVKPTLEKIK